MKQTKLRISMLRLAAAVIFAVLAYNLFLIQVIEGQQWADVADNNRFRHLVQTAPRGNIITADGVELAVSVPGYQVALAYEPDSIRKEQTINILASLLELTPEDISAKLSKNWRRFEPTVIKTNIDFQTLLRLEEYNYLMPSLVIQTVPQRVYPQQTLLAHALGRLVDGNGVEGLEYHWEEYLRGKSGFSIIQVNASNRPVGEPMSSEPAVPGNNLHLTIDAGLQKAAQESLHRVLTKVRTSHKMKDAWTGAVAVVDPNTGRILAMVTEPSFDNNQKYNYPWPEELPQRARTYRDRVINWRKPVGSTIKMLTGLAALESKVITPSEKIRDTGYTHINSQPVRNYASAAYGNVDMRRALEVSSNIYFGTLGARLGREKFYDYVERFGMTGATRGDTPSTAMKNAGFSDISQNEQLYGMDFYRQTSPAGKFYPGHVVQMAYGQLNEFTVLQMANYVSMLANGGTHYKPYLVEKITDADGNIVEEFQPEVISQQDFQAANLKAVREGMHAAAKGGQFRSLPFKIAGKTGTAEEDGMDNLAWWVGYAPYDNPEIAIVVFLEYGGLGLRASEVARDIIDYYFDLK